jgi:hypothetical protein
MVVGSGASLAPTGTGTIQATNIASTITAGSNVTITGSGTTASPYSIASSGGGGGGYTNVTGSASQTTVSAINTCGGTGTCYITTPLSIATGGTVTVPVQFSKAGILTIASGQTVTFSQPVTQTDGPSQLFTGSGHVVLAAQDAPVEWFGAVGDGVFTSGTGTDNTAAINACNTAMTAGHCLLQALQYRVNTNVRFNKSSVGIKGANNGSINFTGGGISGVAPSLLFTTSSSIDILTLGGTSASARTGWQDFRNFNVARTVTPTSTAKGVVSQFTTLLTLEGITSEDSVYDFYYINAATSLSNNLTAQNCASITSYSNSGYGFYFDTSSTNTLLSTRLTNVIAENSCSTGTAYGVYLNGNGISDLMITSLQTGGYGYGFYVNDTSTSAGIASFNIHCNECIIDGSHVAGYSIHNLGGGGGQTPAMEISGGEVSLGPSASYGIDIEGSVGVTVHGVQITNYSSNPGPFVYVNGSIGNVINDNYCYIGNTNSNCITLNNSSSNTVSGNQTLQAFPATTTNTRFVLTAGSTYNNLSANSCQGYGTSCLTFDATSNNNVAIGIVADSHITTPVSDSGSGNLWNSGQTINGSMSLSSIMAGTTGSGTYDFSAATQIKLPVAAAYASAANGEIGYDSTNKNWHLYKNGADSLLIPFPASPTSGDCYAPTVSSGVWSMVDAGGPCGVSGGGAAFSAITSGTNTSATMTVGAGGTLGYTSTGVVNANQVNGATVAANLSALSTDSSGHIVAGSSGGNLLLVESHTASGSATLDFTTCISGSYDEYQFHFVNIVPGTNNVKWTMVGSTNGGSSYLGGTNYNYGLLYSGIGDVPTQSTGSGVAFISLANSVTTTANYSTNGVITLYNPGSSTANKFINGNTQSVAGGNLYQWGDTGVILTTTAINAVRFLFDSGNISSGTVRCYAVTH